MLFLALARSLASRRDPTLSGGRHQTSAKPAPPAGPSAAFSAAPVRCFIIGGGYARPRRRLGVSASAGARATTGQTVAPKRATTLTAQRQEASIPSLISETGASFVTASGCRICISLARARPRTRSPAVGERDWAQAPRVAGAITWYLARPRIPRAELDPPVSGGISGGGTPTGIGFPALATDASDGARPALAACTTGSLARPAGVGQVDG